MEYRMKSIPWSDGLLYLLAAWLPFPDCPSPAILYSFPAQAPWLWPQLLAIFLCMSITYVKRNWGGKILCWLHYTIRATISLFATSLQHSRAACSWCLWRISSMNEVSGTNNIELLKQFVSHLTSAFQAPSCYAQLLLPHPSSRQWWTLAAAEAWQSLLCAAFCNI